MSLEFTQRLVEKKAQSKSERSEEAGQRKSKTAKRRPTTAAEQHLMGEPLQVYSSDAHREHYVELDPSKLKAMEGEYGSHLFFADKKREAEAKPSHEAHQEHEYGSPLFFADRKQEAIRASQATEQKRHNQSIPNEEHSDSEETQEMLGPV